MKSRKRVSDPLEIELQGVGCGLTWILEIAASLLHC